MNKKARKITAWVLLALMTLSVIASVLVYFL